MRKKKKRTPKPRKTLTKEIKRLAATDPFAASQLAARGKVYSEIEELVWGYLYIMEWPSGDNPGDPDAAEHRRLVMMNTQRLCDHFLDALTERDSRRIFKIAEAVRFFQGKNLRETQYVDPVRAEILVLKDISDQCGKKWTLHELETFLRRKNFATPPTLPQHEDGNAALRKLAKSLDFPLAEGRRGRPRKQGK